MSDKKKFLLVSLQESQAQELAQVLANKTSRKILDLLSEKEHTETEIAKKLAIPISTVHYNLAALKKGGLVESENFHYSEKGREVSHYKLANQYIVIAPKSTYGVKEKLKSLLPAIALTGCLGYLVQKLNAYGLAPATEAALMRTATVAEESMAMAAPQMDAVAVHVSTGLPIWLWVSLGAVAVFVFYLLIDWFRHK